LNVGTFSHPIIVISPNGRRVTVDALVDTGSTFTTLPALLLNELEVRPRREVRMRLADGRSVTEQLGVVDVELDGIEDVTYVAFGAPEAPATIGAITLEAFQLGVDPVNQRLVPVEGWLV
jgi:aspartyl protease family protein